MWQERTELLFGEESVKKLNNSHVLVVGVGGVGGYAAEQLARAGIGSLTLVDSDTVHPSNRNRQIVALDNTEGQLKTEILKERFLHINPEISVIVKSIYLTADNLGDVFDVPYEYVVDAIDTLTPKVELIRYCVENNTPLISSMGAGGKFNPELVKIDDVSKSHHCKFAFKVRKQLHKYDIYKGFKVVYSPEEVNKQAIREVHETNKRTMVGTVSYMPAVFGCMVASVVIRDVVSESPQSR